MKNPVIILLVVVIALIIAFAVYMIFFKDKSTTPATEVPSKTADPATTTEA